MTREEIKNTPELIDFLLDESVLADSRTKVRKRLEEVCNLAIKALSQEPICPSAGVDCEDCPAYEPCEVEAAKLQQAYNKGFEDCRQAVLDEIDDTNRRGGFGCKLSYLEDKDYKRLCKALDNENVLDKIRDEIERMRSKDEGRWKIDGTYLNIDYVIEVIDRYRGDK